MIQIGSNAPGFKRLAKCFAALICFKFSDPVLAHYVKCLAFYGLKCRNNEPQRDIFHRSVGCGKRTHVIDKTVDLFAVEINAQLKCFVDGAETGGPVGRLKVICIPGVVTQQ